jgi:hypothetical protein
MRKKVSSINRTECTHTHRHTIAVVCEKAVEAVTPVAGMVVGLTPLVDLSAAVVCTSCSGVLTSPSAAALCRAWVEVVRVKDRRGTANAAAHVSQSSAMRTAGLTGVMTTAGGVCSKGPGPLFAAV